MNMDVQLGGGWVSRSSSSTTSLGLSREESFRRQAAQMSSKSSSSTTSSGSSREESFRRQAGIIVDQLNKGVEQAKIDYMNAQSRGDQTAMNRASKQAEDLRKQGATLGANEDTAATKALKNYYEQSGIKVAISTRSVDDLNKGIYQAKNDYAWAKANNDQAGMAAAAQIATNLRALGGTVSANASLEDARRQADGNKTEQASTQSNSNVIKTVVSTFLDFVPVVGNIKGGYEAATGKDLITGRQLTPTERAMAGASAVTGGVGAVALKSTGRVIQIVSDAEKITKENSELNKVNNIANNYTLDNRTLNDHILERHGPESTVTDKSKFNSNFDIKTGIDQTIKSPDAILKPNTANRSGYIFEKNFQSPIGVDPYGRDVNVLKVVMNDNGKVITAFPKK